MSTLGVLILTRLTLYLLLILGPVFIVFALFPQTRGLFNGWLRTSLVFALAPLLTVLGGTAALMLFVPLIQAIGDDPQAAVSAVQPMVILFMGSLIYCAFLFTLMWVAANLVKDWQATWREKPAAGGAAAGGSNTITPIYPMPAQAAVPMLTLNGGRGSSDAYERTEPLVTAVTREAAANTGSGSRAEPLGLYDPQARASATSGDRFSRVQGLGQRFRPGRPALPTPSPAPTVTPS
ncbi:MAG: type IV secretion system protein [Asticcacaulis sp.]